MHQVGMQERVGEKGPELRAEPARQSANRDVRAVARRNEGEGQQKLQILFVGEREHAQRMHEHQHRRGRDDYRRNVEDGLANSGFDLLRHKSPPSPPADISGHGGRNKPCHKQRRIAEVKNKREDSEVLPLVRAGIRANAIVFGRT